MAGAAAVASGCVSKEIRTDADMPVLLNDRPIAVTNDTHRFDLHQLAPVLRNGFVLLGDLDRYVAASSSRFAAVVDSHPAVVRMTIRGVARETVRVTALAPRTSDREWDIVVETVQFPDSCGPDECVQDLVLGSIGWRRARV